MRLDRRQIVLVPLRHLWLLRRLLVNGSRGCLDRRPGGAVQLRRRGGELPDMHLERALYGTLRVLDGGLVFVIFFRFHASNIILLGYSGVPELSGVSC